jgi:hypothetical protein
MQQVTPEAVTAGEGETAFILQLRPAFPPAADPDKLAEQIDQFVGLYLGAAGQDASRYSKLEPLTWAISAAPDGVSAIADIRADLAETLFGSADGDHVRLVRQGEAPESEAEVAAPEPERVNDPFAGWEPAHSSAATRAAMDGASDVLDLDAPDLDIVDGDVFEVDAWNVEAPAPAGFGTQVGPAPELETGDADDFDTLTEAPERAAQPDGDLAAELAAFRSEMREIAASIPSGAGSDALDQFRSELDSITGALGQRVDGAAQRIESAADRVAETVAGLPDAERMAGAVERAEASAQLMESSVRDAVEALTAALKAMNGVSPDGESQADLGA